MPFKTSPEIDLTTTGLITDAPAHSLTEGAWTGCLNMRIKDGSVQGVNKFEDYFETESLKIFQTVWQPDGAPYTYDEETNTYSDNITKMITLRLSAAIGDSLLD